MRSDTILKGSILDKLNPSIFEIGACGYADSREDTQKYKLWYNMMSRCYNKKDKSYKYYGSKGVIVEERWHRYDYFLQDIEKITGWNEEKFRNKELQLDKDINGQKIYSLENCIFVPILTNQKQKAREYNTQRKIKVAIFPDGHEEIITHVGDFCKKYGLHRSNISSCLRGEYRQTKGYKFYYLEEGQTTIESK